MLNFKTNKKLIIFILAIGVIVISITSLIIINNNRSKDTGKHQSKDTNMVRIDDKIEDIETQIAPTQKVANDKIEVKEDNKANNSDTIVTDSSNQVVPLTKIDNTKEPPPPTPVIKHEVIQQEKKTEKPKSTPIKNKKAEPSAGEKNEKGQVYVPGFGWTDDSGDNVKGISDSKGDINKQIGKMNSSD